MRPRRRRTPGTGRNPACRRWAVFCTYFLIEHVKPERRHARDEAVHRIAIGDAQDQRAAGLEPVHEVVEHALGAVHVLQHERVIDGIETPAPLPVLPVGTFPARSRWGSDPCHPSCAPPNPDSTAPRRRAARRCGRASVSSGCRTWRCSPPRSTRAVPSGEPAAAHSSGDGTRASRLSRVDGGRRSRPARRRSLGRRPDLQSLCTRSRFAGAALRASALDRIGRRR